VLLTTHYLDEAERLCDRVAIVHAGRIVALDTPTALLARLGNELLELRVPDDPAVALRALRAAGVAGDDAFAVGSTITIPLHDRSTRASMDAVDRAALGVGAITARVPTLDDVYLQLTGHRLAA